MLLHVSGNYVSTSLQMTLLVLCDIAQKNQQYNATVTQSTVFQPLFKFWIPAAQADQRKMTEEMMHRARHLSALVPGAVTPQSIEKCGRHIVHFPENRNVSLIL